MFVLQKILLALFSWNTRIEIYSFALLPSISPLFCWRLRKMYQQRTLQHRNMRMKMRQRNEKIKDLVFVMKRINHVLNSKSNGKKGMDMSKLSELQKILDKKIEIPQSATSPKMRDFDFEFWVLTEKHGA